MAPREKKRNSPTTSFGNMNRSGTRLDQAKAGMTKQTVIPILRNRSASLEAFSDMAPF